MQFLDFIEILSLLTFLIFLTNIFVIGDFTFMENKIFFLETGEISQKKINSNFPNQFLNFS